MRNYKSYREREDEIRCRINRALYAENFVDIKNAYQGFLDYANLLELYGNLDAFPLVDRIAEGYSKRAKVLILGKQ